MRKVFSCLLQILGCFFSMFLEILLLEQLTYFMMQHGHSVLSRSLQMEESNNDYVITLVRGVRGGGVCVVADLQFWVPFRGHLEWNDDPIGEGRGLVRSELFEKSGKVTDCG